MLDRLKIHDSYSKWGAVPELSQLLLPPSCSYSNGTHCKCLETQCFCDFLTQYCLKQPMQEFVYTYVNRMFLHTQTGQNNFICSTYIPPQNFTYNHFQYINFLSHQNVLLGEC